MPPVRECSGRNWVSSPGDRVALMLADRVESVEAYLGCFLGGFPAVHVNDRLVRREVAGVLAGADAGSFVYTGLGAARSPTCDAVARTDVVVAHRRAGRRRATSLWTTCWPRPVP